jgi:adenylyltransferase/sulfurtransferase
MNSLLRYSRQIEVIGRDNQLKLLKSSVLVVGAGGLGSAVIAYLAGAGVGMLGIADGDVVEVHNLDRQIVHAGKVGMIKAESAKIFVKNLNPDVKVVTHGYFNEKLNVEKYDVVVSCVDSIETRHKINRVCFKSKKPLVHAAVSGFEGELMVFDFRNGFRESSPCYRCVYPENVEAQKNSVVSPVAGIVGSLQALETIKLICDYNITRELLRMDFRHMEFIRIKVSKKKGCPVCSLF